MSTLTGFLLARIAEDEERARSFEPRVESDARRDLGPGLAWPPYDVDQRYHYAVLHIPLARVVAECEAKRSIVAMEGQLCCGNEEDAGWDVLALLALPYADHPDYRDEWRP